MLARASAAAFASSGTLRSASRAIAPRALAATTPSCASLAWPRTSTPTPALSRALSSTPAPGSAGSVVLLYSGGLDTSCILAWLIDQGYDVHAYMADLGQPEDFDTARDKAMTVGAKSVHVVDLRQDFLDNYIEPAIKCNMLYENLYLLGTSLARPCIAKGAVAVAEAEGCTAVSHGATGKGNDQVRFELSVMALDPTLDVVAPWRDPAFFERFQGRSDLLQYASEKGIPVTQTKAKPYSMDENMLHISYEAGVLEDPSVAAPKDMFRMTVNPEDAPDTPDVVRVHFEKGVAHTAELLTGDKKRVEGNLDVFLYLNELGGAHGVGRVDVVENRFVGIKSRGVYETPAGEILRNAHIGLEGLCLDREVLRLRDTLAARFADFCYNGFWFAPEMEFILHAVEKSQENVTGFTDIELYKGSASIAARSSPASLYDSKISSMDEQGAYNPADAAGFIRINAHRLKAHANRVRSLSS